MLRRGAWRSRAWRWPLRPAGTALPGRRRAPAELIRFGVLPLGGMVESRESWTPLLADLSRAHGRPVTVHSAATYEALGRGHPRDEVDLAFCRPSSRSMP